MNTVDEFLHKQLKTFTMESKKIKICITFSFDKT